MHHLSVDQVLLDDAHNAGGGDMRIGDTWLAGKLDIQQWLIDAHPNAAY